jgi:hypothetical protein
MLWNRKGANELRALVFVLLLVSTPALALEQTQIQAACYTDCEKETHSNAEYKACLARAADTADALLNQEFQRLQDSVKAAAKEMEVVPDARLTMSVSTISSASAAPSSANEGAQTTLNPLEKTVY